jgi:tripeptidyl-peptidase-1
MVSSASGAIQLSEKEIFSSLGIYEVVGEPGKHVDHEVVFAIRQMNEIEVDKILVQVSDPDSPEYGKYMSRAQVAELTTNEASTEAVISYLKSNGISKVRPTAFGEYISATTTIGHWEELLHGRFVTVSLLTSAVIKTKSLPMAYRMLEYTLPEALSEHVVTIFNTIQTPTFPNLPRGNTFDMKASSEAELRNNIKLSSPGVSIPVKEEGATQSWLFGYTHPKLLNSYYNIFTNEATGAATQAVFAAVGQTLALNDQRLFQLSFQLPLEHPTGNIGGHIINGSCQSIRTCGEANLDVQYIMATAQNVPTMYVQL